MCNSVAFSISTALCCHQLSKFENTIIILEILHTLPSLPNPLPSQP